MAAWTSHVDVHARVTTLAARAAGLADGLTLTARALAGSGPDLARWTTIATRARGERPGDPIVRVDGVEGGAPPPSGAVSSAELGGDPFSAATASANRVTMDVSTTPRTRWELSASPGLTRFRARDPLTDAPGPRITTRSASVGGPLGRSRRTSVAFSAASTSALDSPTYVDRAGALRHDATHTRSAAAWNATLTRAVRGFQLGLTAGRTNSHDAGAGIGGEQGPPGALALAGRMGFSRVVASGRARSWTIRAAASLESRRDTAETASTGAGVVFAGVLTDGAPNVVSRRTDTLGLRVHLVASADRGRFAGWLVGADAARDAIEDRRAFNAHGLLIVGAADGTKGTTLARDAIGAAHVASGVVSVFAERVAVDTPRLWLRPGVRLTRTATATTVNPRLTIGASAGTLLFSAAAGLFTEPWAAASEMEWRFHTLGGLRLTDSDGRQWRVESHGSPADRRDGVLRFGVGRAAGPVMIEADQTWRRGWHLSGLTRSADGVTLVDTLDHGRARRERDVHVSTSLAVRCWAAVAHYTFATAVDDTDGPLTFGPDPAAPAPWAAAAHVPRHLASLVVAGALARDYRLMVSAQVESGTAYSRVTGADPGGWLTFTGLDGARNGDRSPGSRDVSAYLARSVAVGRWRTIADVGLRLENLFNDLAPTAIGQISGSARVGRPVAAAPGRSLSLWLTLDWR